MAGEVHPDELADGLDVLLEVVELLLVIARNGAAEAGPHRVDEYEVGGVEDRVRVVDEATGWRERHSIFVEVHPAGAKGSEVEPHRGRPGSAVEGERDGAVGHGARIVPGVGDVEEGRLLLAVLIAQQHPTGRRRVLDGFATDHNRVRGFGELLLVVGRWWHRIVRFCGWRFLLSGLVAHGFLALSCFWRTMTQHAAHMSAKTPRCTLHGVAVGSGCELVQARWPLSDGFHVVGDADDATNLQCFKS